MQREQRANVLFQRCILGAILLEERVDDRENYKRLVKQAVGPFLVGPDPNQIFRGRIGRIQLPEAARLREMFRRGYRRH